MNRSIFKAYSTSILGVFSGLITQLVFIRELAHVVPPEQFALYAFTFQIVAYLNILQLGLDFATSREIAQQLGRGDYRGAQQAYVYIRRFNFRVCGWGLLLVLCCATLFYNGIGVSTAADKTMAALLVVLFGFSLFLSFLNNPSIVALIGSNQQSKVNVNNILVTIITTLTAFVLLKTTKLGIYAMPLALIFFNAFNIFLLGSKAKKACAAWMKKPMPGNIPRDYQKTILHFSLVSTIGGFAWTIEATSDVFILNAVGLLTLVSFYVLWWRFPQMFFDFATRLTTSSLPSLNQQYANSPQSGALIFNRLLILVGGIGFVIYVNIASWLVAFIRIWVGPQFYIEDMQLTSFLIGMLVYSRTIGNCLGMFSVTTGSVNYASTLSWIQAGVKVLLAVLLVRIMGMKGLFVASIAGSLVQVAGCSMLLLKRKLLRPDVLLLLLIGYAAPAILLFFGVAAEVKLWQFAGGAMLTLLFAVLSWALYILIISLPAKLNFSISPRLLLARFRG